ncbi:MULTISPECIES: DsbA family oxidoreductase [Actinomadura]|uniref:DsbA family oxidoreductase n=1 Tax=Actinomadura yumaensis TaxID=111807 RepID=A0ABW2CQE5_9ACTN|nr:DsbA family oxidoreductase [Actinomadura sp. J1-007]MWK37493.1 thioredoxin domain-containing protein [Actinomadura sp. J1-007]
MSAVRLEVYADILCPWCYIGERRLAAALAGFADRDRVEVVRRSFELAPDAGTAPGPTAAEAMREWHGDRAAERAARIRALGAAEGLDLRLDVARPVSTFDAHRLRHLATERGVGDAMMERLLRAYHTEGLNIADRAVLTRLGVATGLDEPDVAATLSGDRYAAEVRADERRAAEHGVTGVPSLLIAGGPPFPGVQSPAALRDHLNTALNHP